MGLLAAPPTHACSVLFIDFDAVEWRIDVDQINARIGQFGELFEVVAAIDDAGVEQRRRTAGRMSGGGGNDLLCQWFCGGPLLCHGGKITEVKQ